MGENGERLARIETTLEFIKEDFGAKLKRIEDTTCDQDERLQVVERRLEHKRTLRRVEEARQQEDEQVLNTRREIQAMRQRDFTLGLAAGTLVVQVLRLLLPLL